MTAKKNIPTKAVAEKLMEKFKSHLGFNNSIGKKQLFKYAFGNSYSEKSYADFYKADVMRRALHMLRVNSNCFVVSFKDESEERQYAVVTTMDEANAYVDVLEKNITKMRRMQMRARRSVREGWHKQKFAFNEAKR